MMSLHFAENATSTLGCASTSQARERIGKGKNEISFRGVFLAALGVLGLVFWLVDGECLIGA